MVLCVSGATTHITLLFFFQIKEPIEGLKEWLDAVSTARIPCAVVSNLDRRNMVQALEQMGLKKYFQVGDLFLAIRYSETASSLGTIFLPKIWLHISFDSVCRDMPVKHENLHFFDKYLTRNFSGKYSMLLSLVIKMHKK